MTELETRLKQASKLVGRGKLSRRDFMQLALASGFTLAAANSRTTAMVTVVNAVPLSSG